jgi:phosphoglycolate phosphatase-like HAD superfamily hydrolase
MNSRCLYLFDIDGTLLSPGRTPQETLSQAIQRITGRFQDLRYGDVAGFTDPLIVRRALQKQLSIDGDLGALINQVLADYLEQIQMRFPEASDPVVYDDGVTFLKRVLSAGEAVGLITGNLKAVARIKLERFGLWDYFPFGVFSDDTEERAAMPWIARERAWDAYHEAFPFHRMVVVGDTVHDARAAQIYGAQSIIVCRRSDYQEQIAAVKPTQMVKSLEEAEIIS